MPFRAILFFTSLTIIAFCLTLYFQTGQNPSTVNWDEYTDLQYNEDRSHSLKDLNEKIKPYELEKLIREIHDKNQMAGKKTRIMEIGSGNGRVVMELKKEFPEIEFYGINKEKTHTFYRRESFILTALKFQLFTKQEIEDVELPYIVFQDLDFGGKIPYDKDKFDLIFSQNTIRHIKYKFELFNEVMRVLKPGGLSLHTDLPTINIYSRGIVMDFKDAIAELRHRGMDIKLLEDPRTLYFRKKPGNTIFPFIPHQAIPANTVNLPQELRRPEMGYNLQY
jgi:ubiquinone/menaquinone biosynthesis C-methylase UbiE